MRNILKIINYFDTLPISQKFTIHKDLIINPPKDELNRLLQIISLKDTEKKNYCFFSY